MVLTINDRQGQEAFAQGGIYKECIMLTSDTPLVGGLNQLLVSPALFDSDFRAKFIIESEYHWKITWPGIAGTFPLQPANFDPKFSNIKVYVKVFSNNVFEVILEYMAVADTHHYLYPYTYQPLNLWQNQSVDKEKLNVYNTANRQIGLRVSIYDKPFTSPPATLLAWVQSDKSIKGNQWNLINFPSIDNRYYLESGTPARPVSGFVPGEDLVIKLRNFPEYTNCQYYCGVFRIDEQLNQSLEFYKEIFMQYCLANNTAAEPFSMATNTILRDKLKNVHGFRYDNFECIADFTIDQSYFVSGARYRFFVVVKESCQYKSYLFDDFGEDDTQDVVCGDLTVTGIKVDDTVLSLADGSCIYDVPVCSDLELKMKLNIASYNADLIAKGLPGNFYNYFLQEVECYISNGEQQLGSNPFPNSVDWSNDGTDVEIVYTFKIPNTWSGTTKYANFVWKFEMAENTFQYVVGYLLINVHQSDQTDIELKSPLGLQDTICDIDAVPTQFCFENPSATHEFRFDLLKEGLKIDDSVLIPTRETDFSTANDACITFDYPTAENEQRYCLKMRAHKPTVELVKPCTDIIIEYNKVFADGKFLTFGWAYELVGWVDADVKHVTVFVIDPITNITLGYFTVNGLAQGTSWFPQISKNPVILNIQVLRTDGNFYFISVPFAWSKDKNTNEARYNICSGAGHQDCLENPILSHTTTWNYFSPPPPYGSILNKTITGIFTLGGAPTGNVKEYRLNGGAWLAYTVPITTTRFTKVELRWTLTYPDCVIVLYDCVTDEECSAP